MRAHDQLALLMAARGASAQEMQSELLQLDQSLASLARTLRPAHPELASAIESELRQAMAQVGKSSLFVFVFQYYLYFVLLRALHLPSIRWWPAYYTVSMTIVYAASRVWMRYDLNRYLTVGYARWRASRALAFRQLSDALAQFIPASHTPPAPPDTIVAAWAEQPPSRARASTSTAAR